MEYSKKAKKKRTHKINIELVTRHEPTPLWLCVADERCVKSRLSSVTKDKRVGWILMLDVNTPVPWQATQTATNKQTNEREKQIKKNNEK